MAAILSNISFFKSTKSSDNEKSLPEKEALYQKRLQEEDKKYAERVAKGTNLIYEHERLFLNNIAYYLPSTVTKVLEAIHADNTRVKGFLIALFNHGHSGTNGPITADTNTRSHVHHGTTRILNADGSFNQAHWDELVEFVRIKQGSQQKDIIRASTLEAFVKYINDKEGYENDSGRRASLTTFIQDAAGKGARLQLFDSFSCGTLPAKNGMLCHQEKCMKLADLELFYRKPYAIFLKAECGLLPVKGELINYINEEETIQESLPYPKH